MLKMYTKDGKWIIVDKGRNIIFDTSFDAWLYVLTMREIRPQVPSVPQSLYPVRTLNPIPSRRCKKVVYQNG